VILCISTSTFLNSRREDKTLDRMVWCTPIWWHLHCSLMWHLLHLINMSAHYRITDWKLTSSYCRNTYRLWFYKALN
jgi:hypothetical protein